MEKAFILRPRNGAHSLLSADRDNHARMRKLVAHAFSEKALREQESYLQEYVDKLIGKLQDGVDGGAQDLVKWYNFTTFDCMLELPFVIIVEANLF